MSRFWEGVFSIKKKTILILTWVLLLSVSAFILGRGYVDLDGKAKIPFINSTIINEENNEYERLWESTIKEAKSSYIDLFAIAILVLMLMVVRKYKKL